MPVRTGCEVNVFKVLRKETCLSVLEYRTEPSNSLPLLIALGEKKLQKNGNSKLLSI